MKKFISLALVSALSATSFAALASCKKTDVTLRVASWAEYIDEGEDGNNSMIEDFEKWYEEQTGKSVKVEYIELDDNETMYNKIKLGTTYDLLCPSEYMIMKLQSEDRLQKYPETFFDASVETNYYAQNVSPFIKTRFDEGKMKDGASKWSEYAAGYMWGTTGFVVKHDFAEEAKSWNVVKNHGKKATAKNNVRDSYFMGLGMYYENNADKTKTLAEMMNDTSVDTMNAVQEILKAMKKSGVRFETDDAKDEIISGNYDLSYQWSGDAVYIMDEAEANEIYYDYVIPEFSSNLWFDGWVLMKGAQIDAATAFVNFISKSENAIRNCDYIGYTPCVAGDAMLEYIADKYAPAENATDEEKAAYDLTYFFSDSASSDEKYVITADKEQLHRQLFAQFPDTKTKERLVVMDFFNNEVNERANQMWLNVIGVK